jgi:hypothetical protein
LVQSNGNMAGSYCSLGANLQCSPQAGGAGTWSVSKQSGLVSPTATPTTRGNPTANARHKSKKRH